jgi:hypothetical protein
MCAEKERYVERLVLSLAQKDVQITDLSQQQRSMSETTLRLETQLSRETGLVQQLREDLHRKSVEEQRLLDLVDQRDQELQHLLASQQSQSSDYIVQLQDLQRQRDAEAAQRALETTRQLDQLRAAESTAAQLRSELQRVTAALEQREARNLQLKDALRQQRRWEGTAEDYAKRSQELQVWNFCFVIWRL